MQRPPYSGPAYLCFVRYSLGDIPAYNLKYLRNVNCWRGGIKPLGNLFYGGVAAMQLFLGLIYCYGRNPLRGDAVRHSILKFLNFI